MRAILIGGSMFTLLTLIENFFLISIPIFIFSFVFSFIFKLCIALYEDTKKFIKFCKNKTKSSDSKFTLKNGKYLIDYMYSLPEIDQEAIICYFKPFEIELNYVLVDFNNDELKPTIAPTGHLLVSKRFLTDIVRQQKDSFSNLSNIH